MQLRGKAESENEVDYKSNSKRRALEFPPVCAYSAQTGGKKMHPKWVVIWL